MSYTLVWSIWTTKNITGTEGQNWSIHVVISEGKKKWQKILETGDFEDSTTIDSFFYTQVSSQFSIRTEAQQ